MECERLRRPDDGISTLLQLNRWCQWWPLWRGLIWWAKRNSLRSNETSGEATWLQGDALLRRPRHLSCMWPNFQEINQVISSLSHCMRVLWRIRGPGKPLNPREEGLIPVVDSGCPTSWASKTGGGSESQTNPGLEPGPRRDRTLPKSFLNSVQVLQSGDGEELTNDYNSQNPGGLFTPPVVQTYADRDQILTSPLPNMRANLFRMDPQFSLHSVH